MQYGLAGMSGWVNEPMVMMMERQDARRFVTVAMRSPHLWPLLRGLVVWHTPAMPQGWHFFWLPESRIGVVVNERERIPQAAIRATREALSMR